MIQACIAGGDTALRFPVEGCEDNAQQGREEIAAHGIGAGDVVIGISASGRAPYVIGAMEEARKQGARTVAVVNNRESRMKAYADVLH